jgi:hypothetical protein
MMMLCLIVLSWLKVSLKKKTENGDCYNPIHKPITATTKPAIYPFIFNIVQRNFYVILKGLIALGVNIITISKRREKSKVYFYFGDCYSRVAKPVYFSTVNSFCIMPNIGVFPK